MNENWKVYVHINKINNKMYIGITHKTVKERWGLNGERYTREDTVFSRAIKKYGWDNFKHIIMYDNFSEKQAKEKERLLIKLFHTYIHDENCNGYNMTIGGEGVVGVIHKKYKMSEETKKLISEKQKLAYKNGRIPTFLGRKHTEETKRKISQQKIGKSFNKGIRRKDLDVSVDLYDLDGNFIKNYINIKTGAEEMGDDPSAITKVCKRKLRYTHNHIWRYKGDCL